MRTRGGAQYTTERYRLRGNATVVHITATSEWSMRDHSKESPRGTTLNKSMEGPFWKRGEGTFYLGINKHDLYLVARDFPLPVFNLS